MLTMKPSPSPIPDEPKKSYREILEQLVKEELSQLKRPTNGIVISGLSAGLDVGLSLMFMGVVFTMFHGVLAEPIVHMLVATMYSVGFIFVILGRSELFTEHTTLAVLPVLNHRASLRSLARLWGLIYGSNLVGAALSAFLTTTVGPALGVIDPEAFGMIARGLVNHSWWVILMSGMLAGWMMGLLSWLVTASRDTISQLVLVWIVTTAIGLSHLHHSIVGTVEVLAAVFTGQGVTMLDYAHFIVWATLGNAIGGVVFVALIKYGHVTSIGRDAGLSVGQDDGVNVTDAAIAREHDDLHLSCELVSEHEMVKDKPALSHDGKGNDGDNRGQG